jgi:sugar lactone lactonase YvrE
MVTGSLRAEPVYSVVSLMNLYVPRLPMDYRNFNVCRTSSGRDSFQAEGNQRVESTLSYTEAMNLLLRTLLAVIFVGIAGVLPNRLRASHAQTTLQTLAVVGGQPDDIAVDARGHLVWGNLSRGTIERLDARRVVTLARGISVPEGIVILPGGSMAVAEQGRDRIVRLTHGKETIIHNLQPVVRQEGVDGIARDPRNGDLLVPDSPRGTILRISVKGRHFRTIAHGLGRPVDAAVDAHGNVLVPDEHLGTLVVITPKGRVSYRGSLSTPDDVSVAKNGRVWITTLGDGGLWLMRPGGAPHRILGGLANPQGLTLDTCGDPIIVEQNLGSIVRVLLTSASRRCAL